MPPTPISGPQSSRDVEVLGPIHEARFPGLCVKCARSADRTLTIRKLFWHDGSEDGNSFYVLGEVDARVCERCSAVHARELQPIPAAIRRKLLRQWLYFALATVVPAGVLLFMVGIVGRKLIEGFDDRLPLWQLAVIGSIGAFFAVCAYGFYRAVRNKGRQLIHENGVRSRPRYVQIECGLLGARLIVEAAPTSVQSAVNFTEDRSGLFERERHRFSFENAEVAAGFAELNADRMWTAGSRP